MQNLKEVYLQVDHVETIQVMTDLSLAVKHHINKGVTYCCMIVSPAAEDDSSTLGCGEVSHPSHRTTSGAFS